MAAVGSGPETMQQVPEVAAGSRQWFPRAASPRQGQPVPRVTAVPMRGSEFQAGSRMVRHLIGGS